MLDQQPKEMMNGLSNLKIESNNILVKEFKQERTERNEILVPCSKAESILC